MQEEVSVTIARLLEEWGMMLVEPAEGSPELLSEDEDILVSKIEFTGVVNGGLMVFSQKGFGEALVKNLLGSDEPVGPTAIEDALKEMANVFCGNIVTLCYGVETVFALASPTIVRNGRDQFMRQFDRPVFCYLADDHPVAVSFYLSI